MHSISSTARSRAQELLRFIDASPSPWHAVDTVQARLLAQGFIALTEDQPWRLQPGLAYFVTRQGGSIIAFRLGSGALTETGFRIVGAHTDSPGLRLKPRTAFASDDLLQLGVEIYGGPILATFADRDLSLAGRVGVKTEQGYEMHLVRFDQALARLPNLAIHMNREVNEQGLKLHKQHELPLIYSKTRKDQTAEEHFRALLAMQLQVQPAAILGWEISAYDTQPGAFWGAQQEFIASGQLDNLASCHAGLVALESVTAPCSTVMCAFFDHEEVGSTSHGGAGGSFVVDVVARIAFSLGLNEEEKRQALARSLFVSADMAHAYHPNFPDAYEPQHRVQVNAGPVIKHNVNQRYGSTAETAARFMLLAEKAGVACQHYAHRTDIGCGSTIGPIIAANLGMACVDVGCAMWAMHSARESAGVVDHSAMIAVLQRLFVD